MLNKKVTYLAAAALTVASLATVSQTAHADVDSMSKAPKTMSAVDNKLSSAYSFTPRITQGVTQIYPFGGKASDWSSAKDSVAPYVAFKLNGNSDQKGKVGMMYANVGNYEGHKIDLKITLMDWDVNPPHKNKPLNNPYAAFEADNFAVFVQK
jgi:hypothetical protein